MQKDDSALHQNSTLGQRGQVLIPNPFYREPEPLPKKQKKLNKAQKLLKRMKESINVETKSGK
jgi:hypothetical protein